jgi:hypothetical protein
VFLRDIGHVRDGNLVQQNVVRADGKRSVLLRIIKKAMLRHWRSSMRSSMWPTVPASAIIFNQDGMQVAVVENGIVHLRKITITTDYGTEVEVSEGVKPGDQVIVEPPVNLADGDKVNTINATPAPT